MFTAAILPSIFYQFGSYVKGALKENPMTAATIPFVVTILTVSGKTVTARVIDGSCATLFMNCLWASLFLSVGAAMGDILSDLFSYRAEDSSIPVCTTRHESKEPYPDPTTMGYCQIGWAAFIRFTGSASLIICICMGTCIPFLPSIHDPSLSPNSINGTSTTPPSLPCGWDYRENFIIIFIIFGIIGLFTAGIRIGWIRQSAVIEEKYVRASFCAIVVTCCPSCTGTAIRCCPHCDLNVGENDQEMMGHFLWDDKKDKVGSK